MKANKFQMIDISKKQPTQRKALAQGKILVGPAIINHLRNGSMPKGDPLLLAEVAGIQGAKQAYQFIPLCHPLWLDQVIVCCNWEPQDNSITVYCLAAACAKTGVEMEALSGVHAALLTIYDICKNVETDLIITEIKLLAKTGGKQQLWLNPAGVPEQFWEHFANEQREQLASAHQEQHQRTLVNVTAAVVTVSQRASSKEYTDKSGKILCDILSSWGATIVNYTVVPDDKQMLQAHINTLLGNSAPQLIITTGGTGVAKMDITSQTIKTMCDRLIPGLGELLRLNGAKYTNYAWLSDSMAGLINDTLIICLPGNPAAVLESMVAIKTIIPHALALITNNHQTLGKAIEHA